MDPVYKRVVLKISGEALAGEKHTGFDFDFVSKVCATVTKLSLIQDGYACNLHELPCGVRCVPSDGREGQSYDRS